MPDLKGAPEGVGEAISAALDAALPQGQSLQAFNAEFLQRHSESAAHVQGAARALELITGSKKESIELLLRVPKLPSGKLAEAKAGLDQLALLGDAAAVQEYTEAASARWPHANAFKSLSELVKEADARDAQRKRWEALADEEHEGSPRDAAPAA